jgi:hypothetical protein
MRCFLLLTKIYGISRCILIILVCFVTCTSEIYACSSVFPRSSGGKGPKSFGRWGSLKDRRHSSQGSLTTLSVPHRGNPRHSADSDSGTECVQTFQRAALYILGEKAQMKVMGSVSAGVRWHWHGAYDICVWSFWRWRLFTRKLLNFILSFSLTKSAILVCISKEVDNILRQLHLRNTLLKWSREKVCIMKE